MVAYFRPDEARPSGARDFGLYLKLRTEKKALPAQKVASRAKMTRVSAVMSYNFSAPVDAGRFF